MSDRLQELFVFVRAAETGSFSKVAREFGLSQPSVSRTVASLETRLGVKLLLRTTRRVTPTDAGAVYLERARRILCELDEAAHAARGVDSLHGVLRVVMSGAFGTREVIPRLPAFLERHPRLKVELLISDRTDDLVAEGADIALRLGPLVDSTFGPACWPRRRGWSLPRRSIWRSAAFRRPWPTSRSTTASSDLALRVVAAGPSGARAPSPRSPSKAASRSPPPTA